MSDPILAKAEKCLAAWGAFMASGERQPVPLYSTEHDEWERQHNELAGAWRDSWRDLLATVPTTQQGAIAMIDAFLLHQEADMDRTQYSELLGESRQSPRNRILPGSCFSTAVTPDASSLVQQLCQLGDIRSNPPRLVQLGWIGEMQRQQNTR